MTRAARASRNHRFPQASRFAIASIAVLLWVFGSPFVKFPSLVLAGMMATTMSLAIAQAPPPLAPPPPLPEAGAPDTGGSRQPSPSAPGAPPTNPSVEIRTATGAEARGGDAPASRWQPELDRLD